MGWSWYKDWGVKVEVGGGGWESNWMFNWGHIIVILVCGRKLKEEGTKIWGGIEEHQRTKFWEFELVYIELIENTWINTIDNVWVC